MFYSQRLEVLHGDTGGAAELWLILHRSVPVTYDQVSVCVSPAPGDLEDGASSENMSYGHLVVVSCSALMDDAQASISDGGSVQTVCRV